MVRRRSVESEGHWAWQYIRTLTPLASPLEIAFAMEADTRELQAGFHLGHWAAFRSFMPRPGIVNDERPTRLVAGNVRSEDVHREWQMITVSHYPQFFTDRSRQDGCTGDPVPPQSDWGGSRVEGQKEDVGSDGP